VIDPVLPGVERLLDVQGIARLFTRNWPGRDRAPSVKGCSLHHVRWTPGHECVASYWLHVEPAGRWGPRTIGVVAIEPGIEKMRLFDDDTYLRGVTALADPARMGTVLAQHLGERIEACSAMPVSYRPAERCTLRVELRTRSGPRVVYAKALAGDAATHLGASLRRLEGAAPETVTPSLVADVPEWKMVVVADAGERRITLDGGALTADDRRDLQRCGAVLARLHRTAGLQAHHAPVTRVELETSSAVVARALPAVAEGFAHAVDRVVGAIASRGTTVPSHGAFRLAHVRFEADRPLLIDLDSLCVAEPEHDLANLLAYVRWWGLRRDRGGDALAAVRVAVQHGYARAGGTAIDPSRLRVWEAASLLKIAARRCRRLAMDEWERVPDLIETAHTLLSAAADTKGAGARSASRSPRAALSDALDADAMSERLAVLLAAPVRVRRAQVVSAKPGGRAVVAYDITVAGRRRLRLFGKVFDDKAQAGRLSGLLEQLGDAGFSCGEHIVPELVGHLPDLVMVLCTSLPGVPLDEVSEPARLDAVASAARWLARLHATSLEMDRVLDLTRELPNLFEWADLVSTRRPPVADVAGRLVERLQACGERLEVRTDVAIHKDFHYRHVLVRGNQIGVVDLDEARAGDPAFDVAHFCANLRLLELRRQPANGDAGQLELAFVRAYASATGYEVDGRHAFFRAYTCLKIAKQLVAGTGPSPVPTGPDLSRQLDAVLREGLRSLAPS
jgi:aminoglycoside phosphotransferase (APT) family kinase protein